MKEINQILRLSLSENVGQIWDFVKEIKKDDIVILP